MSWRCLGRSRDTLSPGKDTETWLSVSITQPVLLELRGQTAHRPPPPLLICMDLHKTKTRLCLQRLPQLRPLRNEIDQTTPHTAPSELGWQVVRVQLQCGATAWRRN